MLCFVCSVVWLSGVLLTCSPFDSKSDLHASRARLYVPNATVYKMALVIIDGTEQRIGIDIQYGMLHSRNDNKQTNKTTTKNKYALRVYTSPIK